MFKSWAALCNVSYCGTVVRFEEKNVLSNNFVINPLG